MTRPGVGPPNAPLMIVGEAYGEHEERLGEPFVGASGQELNRMLHDAGLLRSACYVTNLINARPPDNDITHWIPKAKKDVTPDCVRLHDKMVKPIVQQGYQSLMREIELVRPRAILALGNCAMWALTTLWGIERWRGSILAHKGIPLIPSIHPVNVLGEWYLRPTMVADYRSAARFVGGERPRPPEWYFVVRPTFEQAMLALKGLYDGLEDNSYEWLDFDIETRAGHIACVGISWSSAPAICLPLMSLGNKEGYWPEEEEAYVVWWLYRVLTHPRVKIRWQNGLYDAQYTFKHWHFVPRGAQDTMISWHSIFSDLPKALHFQSSLLSDYYIFWKEEGKKL